ncbi:hypothetical protein GCM10009846_24290 [Agrococcus versicolor]|uniref:Major facilitator superfamily (MFS) profile domain-containing protein n=1 Tax=Agrococcus versicolor TaxID=501482 RepID=A0ABP5MKU5_9MICO
MRNVWTIVGVVVAVVIAWFVVDAMLSLAWLVARLAMVAVVAVIVFVALRLLLRKPAE